MIVFTVLPCSIETVADREGPEAAGGERNVADLLLDQVQGQCTCTHVSDAFQLRTHTCTSLWGWERRRDAARSSTQRAHMVLRNFLSAAD